MACRVTAVAVTIVTLNIILTQTSTSWAADQAAKVAKPEDPDHGKHGGYLLEPEYYGNFFLNTYRIVSLPFRWDVEHWATAGLIVAGIGVMMVADEPVRDFWQDNVRSSTTDEIADYGETVGDFYNLLPAAGIGFVAGAALGDQNVQATALESVQALAMPGGSPRH